MRKPSLTSEQQPSKDQVRRVRTLTTEAVEATLDEEGTFTGEQLQSIHANGGLFKKEFAVAYRAFVLSFARKALGIVAPVRAEDTDLVTAGWRVKSDDLEGEISLVNLDYSSCPVRDGETYVNGDTMLERSVGAYGSLGFADALLELQDDGKEIFPVESRGKHEFVMPRTILLNGSHRYVLCFHCHRHGARWIPFFLCVDGLINDDIRFIRPRQQ